MSSREESLRVGFLAGSLGEGGAERQLVHIVRSLREIGVAVSVYSLTRGEFHEGTLRDLGVEPLFVGGSRNRISRLTMLRKAIRRDRLHVLQAMHFFASPYAVWATRGLGVIAIGSLRSDGRFELASNPIFGKCLLRMPRALIANSHAARRTAQEFGVPPDRIRVLPNVVDLAELDRQLERGARDVAARAGAVALAIGRLIPAKRLDRFLSALASARREAPSLKGIIVGDGSERASLELRARELGLLPDGVEFLGHRRDVPALLAMADFCVLTSDHEGFPNVLLEAMAARLPVITTPAGDCAVVVRDGATGYVVPFEGADVLAERMVQLARSPALRKELGEAGRRAVDDGYSVRGLGERLLGIYRQFATTQKNDLAMGILGGWA